MKTKVIKSDSVNIILVLLVLLFLILGCGQIKEKTNPLVVNIPNLVNKSQLEVDNLLGKPTNTEIATDVKYTPGEFRDYALWNQRIRLTVQFYKGKAVYFFCNITPPVTEMNATDLANLFGFDVHASPPNPSLTGGTAWNGSFGGIRFKDVRAIEWYSGKGFDDFRVTPEDCPIC